jgi:polyisoprenoid-binding protein YceI
MYFKLIKLILISMLCHQTALANADTYNIDTVKSSVAWKGSKVGDDHSGVIFIKSGALEFKDNKLNSGELVIDMNSIKNTDIKDPEKSAKLDGHLKSADFFEVETYPTSKFVFSEAKDIGNGQYSLTGDMTIRGKTNKETFVTKINLAQNKMVAVSDLDIDRTKYGIMYKAATDTDEWFFVKWFKGGADKVINNNLDITLNIVADKKTEEAVR